LEAETFAGTGRHHADDIAAAQHIGNHVLLVRAELLEAKDLAQEIIDLRDRIQEFTLP
jgi:hypothetical protein